MIPVLAELLQAVDCIPDENDRHVLATAIMAHAHAIVTQNTKHFPKSCLEKFAVLCRTPDDFLIHQYHLCRRLFWTSWTIRERNLSGPKVCDRKPEGLSSWILQAIGGAHALIRFDSPMHAEQLFSGLGPCRETRQCWRQLLVAAWAFLFFTLQ